MNVCQRLKIAKTDVVSLQKMSFLGKNQGRTLLRDFFNCCYNQKLFCQFIALRSAISECNLHNNSSIHNGETCLMCTR